MERIYLILMSICSYDKIKNIDDYNFVKHNAHNMIKELDEIQLYNLKLYVYRKRIGCEEDKEKTFSSHFPIASIFMGGLIGCFGNLWQVLVFGIIMIIFLVNRNNQHMEKHFDTIQSHKILEKILDEELKQKEGKEQTFNKYKKILKKYRESYILVAETRDSIDKNNDYLNNYISMLIKEVSNLKKRMRKILFIDFVLELVTIRILSVYIYQISFLYEYFLDIFKFLLVLSILFIAVGIIYYIRISDKITCINKKIFYMGNELYSNSNISNDKREYFDKYIFNSKKECFLSRLLKKIKKLKIFKVDPE